MRPIPYQHIVSQVEWPLEDVLVMMSFPPCRSLVEIGLNNPPCSLKCLVVFSDVVGHICSVDLRFLNSKGQVLWEACRSSEEQVEWLVPSAGVPCVVIGRH